jgi:DNA polymerase
MQIELASPTDVLGFRAQANSLLAHQVPPTGIDWEAPDSLANSEAIRGSASRPPPSPSALHSIVPRSFVRLTELVVLHRDAARFDLLYRLLWRLVHEPELAGAHGDRDMALAEGMAHAVRRDVFRTRRGLQWHCVGTEGLRVAWCEPRHHVTEEVAQWLAKNEQEPPWLLASPDRSVHWDGHQLLCGPGVSSEQPHAADNGNWTSIVIGLKAASAVA